MSDPSVLLPKSLNSATPQLDPDQRASSLLRSRGPDPLPPNRSLAFLVSSEGRSSGCGDVTLADSFLQPASFVVTSQPLPGATADFWRLVYDCRCTAVVTLNRLDQSVRGEGQTLRPGGPPPRPPSVSSGWRLSVPLLSFSTGLKWVCRTLDQ